MLPWGHRKKTFHSQPLHTTSIIQDCSPSAPQLHTCCAYLLPGPPKPALHICFFFIRPESCPLILPPNRANLGFLRLIKAGGASECSERAPFWEWLSPHKNMLGWKPPTTSLWQPFCACSHLPQQPFSRSHTKFSKSKHF